MTLWHTSPISWSLDLASKSRVWPKRRNRHVPSSKNIFKKLLTPPHAYSSFSRHGQMSQGQLGSRAFILGGWYPGGYWDFNYWDYEDWCCIRTNYSCDTTFLPSCFPSQIREYELILKQCLSQAYSWEEPLHPKRSYAWVRGCNPLQGFSFISFFHVTGLVKYSGLL